MEKEFIFNGENLKVDILKQDETVSFVLNGKEYSYQLKQMQNDGFTFSDGNINHSCKTAKTAKGTQINIGNMEALISLPTKGRQRVKGEQEGSLRSPMPGKIFKIVKEVGSDVKKGEVILILEAMKMEHAIRANIDGTISDLFFKEGELVDDDVELLAIAAKS